MAPDIASTITSLFRPDMRPRVECLLDQHLSLVSALPPSSLGFDLKGPPDSCQDFLNLCERMFSWEFCKAIESRIHDFDAMVEAGNDDPQGSHVRLSDTFITDRSRAAWLEIMIDAIDVLYINLRKRYNAQSNRLCCEGYDGHHDAPEPSRKPARIPALPGKPARAPVPAPAAASRIQQIILRGPDLRTAWAQNPITATWQPLRRGFTPQHNAAPMIFHGTKTKNLTSDHIAEFCRGEISLYGHRNQIAPWGVFHTSFYGLRSFLWAVFNVQVITPNLETSALANLNATFQLDGVKYRGVLVLAFYTQTPSPGSLHAETIDGSFITKWANRCEESFRPGPTTVDKRDKHWQNLAYLHGGQSMKWPDILHAPEEPRTQATLSHFFGRQQAGLLPSTGPLWRSAHCTEAAMHRLGENIAGVYAITFEQEQPNTPRDSKERKESHKLLRRSMEKLGDKMERLFRNK